MAPRIHFARPAGAELQRALLELLDYMIRQLEQCGDELPVESVHEARKTSKKIRALLGLVSGTIARPEMRRWRGTLRAAAANLALQRDRTVLIEALKRAYRALVPDFEPTSSPWLSLRLMEHISAGDIGEGNNSHVAEAIVELRAIHTAIAQSNWDTLTYAAALRMHVKEFRRARKLLHSLREDRDSEQMHQWRKHVKAHLYQMRLFVNLAPKMLRADAVEFYQLAELLGEHNDLANLNHAISSSRATFLPIVELPGLESWVHSTMKALEQDAMRLGERLLSERPKSRIARFRKLLHSASDKMEVATPNDDTSSSIPPTQSTNGAGSKEHPR